MAGAMEIEVHPTRDQGRHSAGSDSVPTEWSQLRNKGGWIETGFPGGRRGSCKDPETLEHVGH